MKSEIGSYEAKTRLPELLRQVEEGKSFTITNRGRAVADLVPHEDDDEARRIEGVRAMHEFVRTNRRVRGVNIRELIEEGRD